MATDTGIVTLMAEDFDAYLGRYQGQALFAVTDNVVRSTLMSDDCAPASTTMIATVAMIRASESAWNPANHAAARRDRRVHSPGESWTRLERPE